MSKSNTKVRKLGAIRQLLKTPVKDEIPKLSSFHAASSSGDGKGGMVGITGSALAVPPQKEKNAAREKETKPSSVSIKSDSGKSDSASSTKSQELSDKKEIQDLKARERDLLKQISSLQKLVDDLQEQIRNKEVEVVSLQDQILRQEESHKAALLEERTSHDATRSERDHLLKELEKLKAEVKAIREENVKKMEELKKELEEKHSLEIAEKDKEIKIRDEKLNRLKMQMADALKGNSWERQQQLEELTKELGRLQEEADGLRMKLKSFKTLKNNTAGGCGNCQESLGKVEKFQLAVKERDATIKDLKALVTKFEKQLTQQDELLKSRADSKGFRTDYAQNYRITGIGNCLYFPSESEVVVWNLKKEQWSGILPHPVPLRDAISWGWKTMVTATDDTTVRVWDLEGKEKETKNQSVVLGHVIQHFVPMNNPRYAVVMAQTDRTDTESVCLQVYDILTKKVVREGTPNLPPGVIKILNDKQIAVVTYSRKIKTINLDTMTVDKVFEGDVSAYTVDLQVKSDGSEILTHTRGRQQFKIYNATTGKTKAIIRRPSNVKKDKKSPFEEIFYVNKGWTVLAGRISVGPWLVYDLSTLQCIKSISPNEYNFSDIPIEKTAMSEDGQTLVFAVTSYIESPGSTTEKYQLTSFAILCTKENRGIVTCEDIEYQNHYFEIVNRKGVDVSVDEIHVLDDNRLLTVHDDFILRVWDRNTGELLNRLEGHRSAVRVFMKEDGPYIFSYAEYEEENAIRVWDKSTLQCIASYRLDQTVVSTTVCSDGKQFITSTRSPTARLIHWRVEGVDNSTNLSSCPMLYKGTASNPNLALVVDDDDLVDENDLDTDEEESDEDD